MDLKVCVLPFRISASGIASYTIELANALAQSGLNITLIGFEISKRINELDPSIECVDIGNDPVKLMYLGGPITDYFLLSKKLKNVIKNSTKNFDLLHFTLAAASLSFDQGFVATSWAPISNAELIRLHPKMFRFPKNLLANVALVQFNFMEDISFLKASRIVSLVKATYERMLNRYGKKSTLIPPPINIKNEHRGSNDDKPSLLFVARDLDYPKKNLKTLLQALNILANRGIKNFRFFLVGKGVDVIPTIEELKNRGLEIVCLGRLKRNDVLELMDKSDIFVSPSLYEELNYVTLEALGSGLPIIASDIPPFRDLVIDGENGYLVPPTDHKLLAERLEELIINHKLRENMSRASLRLAKLNFSYDVVGNKLIKLYSEILNEK